MNFLLSLFVLCLIASCDQGGESSGHLATLESPGPECSDTSSGALCAADTTEVPTSCTGKVNLTDQGNGSTYLAEVSDYPDLKFFATAYPEEFKFTVSAPCADIEVQKMVFDVTLSNSFSTLPIFEMRVDNEKVGEVNAFVSGDVSPKQGMIVEWTTSLVISKSVEEGDHDFALMCVNNCETASRTVCLKSVQWGIMLYDGHGSQPYVAGTPNTCQEVPAK